MLAHALYAFFVATTLATAGLLDVVATIDRDKPAEYAEVVLMNLQTRTVIRKSAGRNGSVRVGWIPSGRYRIAARHHGRFGEIKDIDVGSASISLRIRAITPASARAQ